MGIIDINPDINFGAARSNGSSFFMVICIMIVVTLPCTFYYLFRKIFEKKNRRLELPRLTTTTLFAGPVTALVFFVIVLLSKPDSTNSLEIENITVELLLI